MAVANRMARPILFIVFIICSLLSACNAGLQALFGCLVKYTKLASASIAFALAKDVPCNHLFDLRVKSRLFGALPELHPAAGTWPSCVKHSLIAICIYRRWGERPNTPEV